MSVSPSCAADVGAFEQELRARGFVEVQVRDTAPGVRNEAHAHPFEVRALLLAGELQLSWDGRTETYHAGDIFTMASGCEHVEQFGAAGASALSGRKYPG